MTKVFLVGMPGCGKSTVGKGLAQRLGYAFLDLDTLVEEREKLTVAQVFEQHGQDYFRQAEAAALRSVLDLEGGVVLATGGGAPCFHENMAFMVQHGHTIYLKVSPAELVRRLSVFDLQVRPLLRDKTPDELLRYLSQTLAQREVFYNLAPFVVDVDGLPVEEVAKTMETQINVSSY
ncbi:MAG: shikimate kinase [Rufibacter sp.]